VSGWRDRFAAARVAVLSSVTAQGTPHLVPVTFALTGDTLWTATDGKPKRGTRLRRHTNIATQPRVSLLVSHWDEDWTRLWWVRADGLATVTEQPATVAYAVDLLRRKYPQYKRVAVGAPVIEVMITDWHGWPST
jgi:PPOX class probable F420-dependent enzyme